MLKIDKLKQNLQNGDNFTVQSNLSKVTVGYFSNIDEAIEASISAPKSYLFVNLDLKAVFKNGELTWLAPYLI